LREKKRKNKMKTSKRIILSLSLVLACVTMLPTLSVADTWNRATKLTFSEPVEVPGMVLPSGTYWFTLANSQSNRNIVQIWNGDRTQLLKTIIAIPNYRMQPTSDTVIHFSERPTGTPEAIKSWFYPGMNYGQEFVYPKARAVQLAQQTSQPVLSVREEPKPEEVEQTPVAAVTPSGEEVEITEVIATAQVVPAPVLASQALPQTGSMLPLVALLGMLCLVGGFGLRSAQQKA
jgi:hypothetical protein